MGIVWFSIQILLLIETSEMDLSKNDPSETPNDTDSETGSSFSELGSRPSHGTIDTPGSEPNSPPSNAVEDASLEHTELGPANVPLQDETTEGDHKEVVELFSEFHLLDPNSKIADRVVLLVVFVVLFFGSAVASIFFIVIRGIESPVSISVMAAGGAISFLVFLMMLFWPSIEYKNVRWRLDKLGFEIHKGVFWKHRIAVPLARIQHVDVTQGPIERIFSLGSLVVYTAGSNFSDVRLSGLSHQDAKDLKDHILRSREAQHVL